jgi:Putative Ig domain
MLSDALPPARIRQPSYRTRQFSVFTVSSLLLCCAMLVAAAAGSSPSTSSETTRPSERELKLSGTLPAAEVGITFNTTLKVSGGTAPYTFSISWGGLPPGLSLSTKSGTISGQPTQSGNYNFGVHVTDSSDQGTGHAFLIAVAKAPSIVVTVTPATATVGSATSTQFTALVTNTSNLGVTWSASSETISRTGLYQAPTVSANTTVTVTATSTADTTKSATASVTVTPPPPPPVIITTTSLSNATAGTAYSNTLTATGGTTPFSWTLSSGSLPSGITVQSAGSLSGTASQSGTFNISVQVADSSSPKQTSSVSLTLTVVAGISVTVIPTTATVASSGTEQFTALVSNTSNVAVIWAGSPGTISNSGMYSAPVVTANTTATVTATSTADPTKSATASVTVTPPPPPPLIITTTSLSTATAGAAYSNPLNATGGTAPYTWTLSSGSLPTGITLQSAGSLSGTTSKTGQFTITVETTDSSSPQQNSSVPLTLTVNSAIGTGPTLAASYFGFSWNYTDGGTWPGQSYGMQRFWDSPSTQWPDINTASGVFDFTKLDSDLALAYTKGTMVGMYTLARTPTWASSNPTDTSCNNTTGMGGGDGECDAPSDLNGDGSGTNAIWKAFITALAAHVNDSTYLQTHAHIKYWEIWNEPDTQAFFAGTIAQLARLTEDANCIITGRGVIHQKGNGTATSCTATPIDPTAQIVMASAHAKGTALKYGQNELYCNGSPKTYQLPCPNPPNAIATAVDIINFHMKPGNETGNNCPAPTPCTPESAMQMYVSNIRGMLQSAELSKPLWDGEAQYSSTGFSGDYLSDTDLAASFMPRFYLINWTLNVSGIAWYTAASQAEPVEAQTSYQQTYNWLAGASLTTPCAATGTLWSCGITISGKPYLILWDTSQTCANGSCSTANQAVATQWTQYQDMTAASTPNTISGGMVPVGIKPVLLN